MKTVEERLAEVDKMAHSPHAWSQVREEIAKHLTQQAAEWQIAVNEAESKFSGALQGAEWDREELRKRLAFERLRGEQAVAMERKNWEAPLDSSYKAVVGMLEGVLESIHRRKRPTETPAREPERPARRVNQPMGCLLEDVIGRLDELEARLDTIQKG